MITHDLLKCDSGSVEHKSTKLYSYIFSR